jgi:hypothetical protein
MSAKISQTTLARIVEGRLIVRVHFRIDFSPVFTEAATKRICPPDVDDLDLPHFNLCEHVCSRNLMLQGQGLDRGTKVNSHRLTVGLPLIQPSLEDLGDRNPILKCSSCEMDFQSVAQACNETKADIMGGMAYEVFAWRDFGECTKPWSRSSAAAFHFFCERAVGSSNRRDPSVPGGCCKGSLERDSFFPVGIPYFEPGSVKGLFDRAAAEPEEAKMGLEEEKEVLKRFREGMDQDKQVPNRTGNKRRAVPSKKMDSMLLEIQRRLVA